MHPIRRITQNSQATHNALKLYGELQYTFYNAAISWCDHTIFSYICTLNCTHNVLALSKQ